MKRVQIMANIDASIKHCSFWNICNIEHEHEPEITGMTAPATATTRQSQPECFLFRE